MTRDQIGSDSPPAGMDDDRLADLVRAAATDWTMPPQRLDHTTWRDRVVVSGPRRARGRVPRLAIPLAGAVAVTVALAFTAVWLDGSRRSAVTGASPSPTGTSAATSRPTASDGKAIVNGALPDPASVLVAAGEDYRVADLSAGRLGPDVFGRHSGPKTVVARPDGGWLCVCGGWDGVVAGWGCVATGAGPIVAPLRVASPSPSRRPTRRASSSPRRPSARPS